MMASHPLMYLFNDANDVNHANDVNDVNVGLYVMCIYVYIWAIIINPVGQLAINHGP